MKLRQLEAFRALMIGRTVTRAAEILFISQPATTRLIANLEDSLGFALFERRQGRLFPTAEAELLYDQVQRCFIGLSDLQRTALQIKFLERGKLDIAVAPCLGLTVLPDVIKLFLQKKPDVSIRLLIHASVTILNMLRDEQCDLGLTVFSVNFPSPNGEHLFSGDLVCAVPAKHPLAQKETIQVEDLQSQHLILGTHEMDMRMHLDVLLATHGVQIQSSVETQTSAAMCSFVEAGLGLAIIDPLTALTYTGGRIIFREFRPSLKMDISAIFPERDQKSLLMREFVVFLKAYMETIFLSNTYSSSRSLPPEILSPQFG